MRIKTTPCKDCRQPTVFTFAAYTSSAVVLLCEPCLEARVDKVREDPEAFALPQPTPDPRNAGQARLLELATAHPDWRAQHLVDQLNAEGHVKTRGDAWDRNSIHCLLQRWGVWQRKRHGA